MFFLQAVFLLVCLVYNVAVSSLGKCDIPNLIYPIIRNDIIQNGTGINVGVAYNKECLLHIATDPYEELQKGLPIKRSSPNTAYPLKYVQSEGYHLIEHVAQIMLVADKNTIALNVACFSEPIFECPLNVKALATHLPSTEKLFLYRLERKLGFYVSPKTLTNLAGEELRHLGNFGEIIILEPLNPAITMSKYAVGSPICNASGDVVALYVNANETSQRLYAVNLTSAIIIDAIINGIKDSKEAMEVTTNRKMVQIKKSSGDHIQTATIIGTKIVVTVLTIEQIFELRDLKKNLRIEHQGVSCSTFDVHMAELPDNLHANLVVFYLPNATFTLQFDLIKQLRPDLPMTRFHLHQYGTSALKFSAQIENIKNPIIVFQGLAGLNNKTILRGAPLLKGNFLFGLVIQLDHKEVGILNLSSDLIFQKLGYCIQQFSAKDPYDVSKNLFPMATLTGTPTKTKKDRGISTEIKIVVSNVEGEQITKPKSKQQSSHKPETESTKNDISVSISIEEQGSGQENAKVETKNNKKEFINKR